MVFNGMIVTPYVLVLAGILGLVVGSFVNCWAWRYVNGESAMKGRSHCTSCGHDLGVLDLVPVFSWLFSRGRCRYCGEKVSARYPLTELATCVAFVVIAYVYGLSWETVELLLFASALLFLTLTDIDAFVIPNGCIVFAIIVRVAYLTYCWFTGEIGLYGILFYVGSAFGMGVVLLVVVLVTDRVLGRESMGGGDLKLFAVAGLYFGWQQGVYLVVLSCLIGIFVGLLCSGGRGKVPAAESDAADAEPDAANSEESAPKRLSRPFPFGPSIAIACVITMLVGGPFVSWYIGLL